MYPDGHQKGGGKLYGASKRACTANPCPPKKPNQTILGFGVWGFGYGGEKKRETEIEARRKKRGKEKRMVGGGMGWGGMGEGEGKRKKKFGWDTGVEMDGYVSGGVGWVRKIILEESDPTRVFSFCLKLLFF